MKKFLLIALQLFTTVIFAQSPQVINYQGIARDAAGQPIKNTSIGIKFELRQGSATSPTVFVETQTRTTNDFGLFTTQIGNATTNGLAQINWTGGSVFLQIGIDAAGGTNYVSLGNPQQLVSVPYAMHAESVPATYSNNILTVGKQSFTLASGGATTDIQGGTNVNVSGTYPNYTVSSTPTLNLLAPSSLSISGGNTVDISPPLTYTNNVLTIGAPTNSVLLQTGTITVTNPSITAGTNVVVTGVHPNFTVSATPTLNLLSPNTLSISGGNTVDIAPTLSVSGNVLSVGPSNNTVSLPSSTLIGLGAAVVTPSAGSSFSVSVPATTLTNGTNVTINGSYPAYTINSVPTLTILSGNLLQISGGNTVPLPTSSGTLVALTTTLQGSGAAYVYTLGANDYSIHVPPPTYNNITGVLNTGSLTTVITPTLLLSGNVLSSGPASNSVVLPSAPTVVGNGIAAVSSGPNYTVNVPTPVLSSLGNSITLTQGTVVTTASVLSTPNTTITPGGIASVSNPATNSFVVSVPSPTFTNSGPTTISGTYPNLTITSPTVPAATPNTTITPGGIASVSNPATNSFVVSVPSPTFTPSGPTTISGTYPNLTITSPTVGTTPTVSAAGIATVSAGPNYLVGVPSPTFTNSGPTTISGTYPNLTITSPTVPAATPNTTITQGGIAAVSNPATNSFVVSVPSPTFTPSGPTTISGTYPNLTITSPTVPAATPNTTITPGGIAAVSNPVTNSFVVSVPSPTFTPSGPTTISGTYPNLTITSPTIATTPTVSAAGIATVSAGPNYVVGVQSPTFTNSGPTTISGTYPNLTITSPTVPAATPNTTITPGGIAAVSNPVTNSFVVSVPSPTFTPSGPTTISGTYPNLTITSPTVPAATPNTTITPGGIAAVTNPVTNSFVVSVPSPTFTPSGPTTISGTYPNLTITSPTIATTPTVSAAGIATVSAGPNYVVGVQTPVFTNATQNIITGTYPNYSVNTPTIANTSIALTATAAAGPSLTSSGTNSFNINIPPASQPTFAYSQTTGSLTSGTSSAYITPNLSLSGSTLTSGPSSNSISLSSLSPWTQSAGSVTLATASNNVGIGTASPGAARLHVMVPNTDAANSTALAVTNNYTVVTGSKIGIQVAVDGSAAGANKYGMLTTMTGAGGSSDPLYGNFLEMIPNGTAANSYGFYSNTQGVGTGPRWGMYSTVNSSAGNASSIVGLSANTNKPVGSSGNIYNLESNVTNNGTGASYNILGTNAGSAATRYGVYMSGETSNYFSNNVGIGSTLANEKLHVTGNIWVTGALMPNGAAGTSGQYLVSAGAGAPPVWTSIGSGTAAAWSALGNSGTIPSTNYLGTSDLQDLVFRTNATERMRILSGGNIGMGSTNPTENLQIERTGSAAMSLISGAANASSLYFGTSANHFLGNIRYDNSNNSMNFWTNNTANRLVILGNGNVGIGLATPSNSFAIGNGTTEKFNINGVSGDMNFLDDQASITFTTPGAGSAPMIQMFPSGTSNLDRMVISHSSTYPDYGLQYQDASDKFNFLSAGTPVLTADLGTQNVGIGTSSPTQKLDVTGYIREASGPLAADEGWLISTPAPGFSILRAGGRATTEMRIEQSNNAPMTFLTNASEKMRILGNGNIGIGTNSPTYKLSIFGNSASALNGPNLSFVTSDDIYPTMHFLNYNHNEQWMMFNSYYDGGFKSSNATANFAIATQNYGTNALHFKYETGVAQGSNVSWTDAMVIRNNGNIGIGTTTPAYPLHAEKNSTGILAYFDNNSTAGGTGLLAQVNTNSLSAGTRYGIDAQTRYGNGSGYGVQATSWYNSATNYGLYGYGFGGVTSYGVYGLAGGASGNNYGVYCSGNGGYTGTWLNVSDQKFKENIQPYSGALDKILRLQPKTYTLKKNEYDYMGFPSGTQIGLIAQEVEQVIPELVENSTHPGPMDEVTKKSKEQPIDYKGMNYIGLTPVLVQAIKEQQAQIEDMKKQLAEQKKQIEDLQKK